MNNPESQAPTHDVARSPENGYHMFVLGLLVALEGRYAVRSNLEAGFGRYDILMTPARPGDPGIVIEFKAISGKSLPASRQKSELEGALQQIEDRRYADELWSSGAKLVRAVAVVGNGKRIASRFKTLSKQETQPA